MTSGRERFQIDGTSNTETTKYHTSTTLPSFQSPLKR